jgi:hypothetical protein
MTFMYEPDVLTPRARFKIWEHTREGEVSSRAYADIGQGEHTPICLAVGTKTFRPQRHLRNLQRRTKSTHKAHTSIFYPDSGHPLANNPTSCFGEFSGVGSVQDDEHLGAGTTLSLASTPPGLPLPLVFTPVLSLSFSPLLPLN